jgi:hypothetical protein
MSNLLSECHVEGVWMVPATYSIMLVLCEFPEFLTFKGDTKLHHHCTKFSIHVFVASGVVLWIQRTFIVKFRCSVARALCSSHCRHILHSVVGKYQFASNFRVPCQMFCERGCRCRCSSTAAVQFPLQKPYTDCILAYYLCVNRLGMLTLTAEQHNTRHTSPGFMQAGTLSSYSSSVAPRRLPR